MFTAPDVSAQHSAVARQQAKAMTLPDAIESLRPSVVQILIQVRVPIGSPGGIPGMQPPLVPRTAPIGSGFFVVKLFDSIPVQGPKQLMVGLALPNLDHFKSGGATVSIRGSFVLVESQVIDEDERHDIAVLKLSRNPFKDNMPTIIQMPDQNIKTPHKVPTLWAARPRDGEAIAVSGYPLSSPVLVTTSGYLASSWGSDVQEVHVPGAPEWLTWPELADSYLADVHVNPGNSGGPVYSVRRGQVIGVCVSFALTAVVYSDGSHEPATVGNRPLAYNSGLSNVVPVTYVLALLKKNNLKWTEAN
jgi:S1-C subfamily serine protease